MESLRRSTWLQSLKNRLKRGRVDEEAIPEVHEVAGIKAVFPYLPATRPRRLSISDSDELPIQQGLFFQKLPLEIRRMIYVELFGNRRLHIYLGPNKAKTEWEWRGFVCHRIQKLKKGKMLEQPFEEDECVDGRYVMCGWLPDKSDCLVKALPWLQSCRQAYSEGIDLLYSSNEFHLQTYDKMVLFYNLQSLFLSQRLACIKRLELQTQVGGYSPKISVSNPPLSEFENLLQILCSNFPRLSRLSMSITSPSFNRERVSGGKEISIKEALLRAILSPMDNLVRHFGPQLQYCVFVIGESYYSKIKETHSLVEIHHEIIPWRELRRSLTIGNAKHEYWIQQSSDIFYPPSGCFGAALAN